MKIKEQTSCPCDWGPQAEDNAFHGPFRLLPDPIGNNFKDEPQFRTLQVSYSVRRSFNICIFIGFPQCTARSLGVSFEGGPGPGLSSITQKQKGRRIMDTIEFRRIITNWNLPMCGCQSQLQHLRVTRGRCPLQMWVTRWKPKIIINGFVRDSQHDRLMMIRLLWRDETRILLS